MLAVFDPAGVSAEDCAQLADELAATEKSCSAARLLAARRACEGGRHRERGFGSAASWVARQGGTTTAQARRSLETAAKLEGCAATKKALLAGEVSIAQAQLITLAEAETPGQERDLLEVARGKDLSGLRDEVRDRRAARSDPEMLHRRQWAARRFRHWRDQLGMVCFEGALPPEAGIPFVARVEHIARRRRTAARRNGTPPGRFELYAADAVAALGAPPEVDGGERKRVPAEVVLVCDLFAYRRGHAEPGEVCHIVGGGPVPVTVVHDFAADAFVKAVLHDGVEIHAVKHFGRRLPAELRTALDLGPVPTFTGRRCVDCGSRYGLEYDHVDPVANHGPTSYANLVTRCYADHQAKTERDRKTGLLGRREQQRGDIAPRAPRRSRARAPDSSRAGPAG